jgi:hypothetical protein
MLIYLDANIVQYTADYADFLCGNHMHCPIQEPALRGELYALRELIQLEQFGNWTFASPEHLQAELHRGRVRDHQKETYELLEESADPEDAIEDHVFRNVIEELLPLGLSDRADRVHVATAVAMGASWFLTNDTEILRKVGGQVRSTRVAKPSECIEDISVGLFLR